MSIKNEIKEKIKLALNKLNIEEENIIIEIPKDKTKGDYSTNIAMVLTKKLGQKPMDTAKQILEVLELGDLGVAEIALPGFINFHIDNNYLLSKLNDIIKKDRDYGKNNTGHGKKVNIEFVSANPTGYLHVGHGRGATYGDNLARIMTFSGYDITKEYYINDAGNQMNNLGISIKERYKEICGLSCNLPDDGYHGKEIIMIAKDIYEENGNQKLNEDIEYFKQIGLDILMSQIKKVLDEYRVNFDVFTSEKSLYDRSLVDDTLSKLQKSGKCYIEDGALWLKTTDYGDEKDRVLIKHDGAYTYLLPDIAYHVNKLDRGFDELIDVLGSDHHGYINRLKASLEILEKDATKLDIKILQMVRLIKDGEEVKISKRTGKTITLTDLIDDLGVNRVRYFFSSKSLDSQMDFNLSLAASEDMNNPLFYIEYANARISSILSNYSKELPQIGTYTTLNTPQVYTILNKLYEFEDVVVSAATKKLPHLIALYAYDLATLFHSYYNSEKIINENDAIYTNERIIFIKAIKIVLNNALQLLGILPRERM